MTKPVWWTSAIGKINPQQTGPPPALQDERAALKKQEAELLKEALGFSPAKQRAGNKVLEQHEMEELCKRGNTEHDMYTSESRVAGLGYAPAPTHRDNLPSSLLNPQPPNPAGSIFERGELVHVDDQLDDDHADMKRKSSKEKTSKSRDTKKDSKEKKHKHKHKHDHDKERKHGDDKHRDKHKKKEKREREDDGEKRRKEKRRRESEK